MDGNSKIIYVSRRAEHSAACVWVAANAGRRPQDQKAKTADLVV